MSEIKSLISRSGRYMKSARLLMKDKDYESAVSRVYYAMFYCVEALLLTRELSFSSHKGVISAFGKHFVKTGIFSRDHSKALTKAFEKRQIGDYEFTFVITNEDAKETIKEGKEFLTAVLKYLKATAQYK